MLIVGVSASLRRGSHYTSLLRAAARGLPAGIELARFGALADIPPFDEDHERDPAPTSVRGLREAIRSADAILIATPEYNGSITRQLKTALDWASRPFATNALRGMPVAVIGASTGPFGAVWAQADLRRVLHTIGARVVGRELPIATAHIVRELLEAAEARPSALAA